MRRRGRAFGARRFRRRAPAAALRSRGRHRAPTPRRARAFLPAVSLDADLAHVLVALSSVAFTAASGHTLRTIRDRRRPERRGRDAPKPSTPRLRGDRRRSVRARRARRSRRSASDRPGTDGTPEERVAQLGLELDGRVATNPAGVFYPACSWATSRTSAARCPETQIGACVVGKCGDDISDEDAVEAARIVGLTMLATMRQQFGSLDNVLRVVKVPGAELRPVTVNPPSSTEREPSHRRLRTRGEGRGERWGDLRLPLGIPVEAEAIVERHVRRE